MPSVRSLAEELKVNVNTVQRVYQELEREGVLLSQRGIGSFVTNDEETLARIKREMARELLETFVRGMRELGFSKEETLTALQAYMEGEQDGNLNG